MCVHMELDKYMKVAYFYHAIVDAHLHAHVSGKQFPMVKCILVSQFIA